MFEILLPGTDPDKISGVFSGDGRADRKISYSLCDQILFILPIL